jgi:hypothetical protein
MSAPGPETVTIQQPTDETVFRCWGRECINVHPIVGLAFIITLMLIISDVVLIFVHPEWSNILIPVLTGITTFWVPSPMSSVKAPSVRVPLTISPTGREPTGYRITHPPTTGEAHDTETLLSPNATRM